MAVSAGRVCDLRVYYLYTLAGAFCTEDAGVCLDRNRFRVSGVRCQHTANTETRHPNTGYLCLWQKIFYHEGGEYNWPTVSGFYFNKEANDKGVMMDRGAHVIDLICWWLDDEIEVIQFEDDSLGGPEAFCHAVMRSDYCEIDVKLSWLNKLSNEYRIVGIDGDISGSIYNWKSYELTKNGKKRTIKVQHKEDLFDDFGQTVFENFIKMIIGDSNRISINASDVLQSIELIEKMYNNRQKINSPWQDRWLNYAE